MGLSKFIRDPLNWGLAFGIALVATVIWMPFAQAELVYENEAQPAMVQPQVAVQPQVVVQPAQVQATPAQIQPAYIQPQMAVQPAMQPAYAQPLASSYQSVVPNSATDIQNLSKTELMRRERVREELRNEDLLQERLEDLRLKDEKRRTDQVLGLVPASDTQMVPAHVMAAPVTDQMVAPPVTEKRADAVASAMILPGTPVHTDQIAVSSSVASTGTDWNNDKTYLAIAPRFGIQNMSNTGYDIRPRFATGVGLGLDVSDNVGFECGYTYSELGLSLASNNGYAMYWSPYGYQQNYDTHVLKSNIFDAGIKLHVLGMDSRLRPFVGGGGGYRKSFLNYDSTILNSLNQIGLGYTSPDYSVDSFLGYVTTGLDIRASRSISVGASFRYYTVLTTRENAPLNNAALYGFVPNYAYMDPAKQWIGGTLARDPFYTITGSVNFVF